VGQRIGGNLALFEFLRLERGTTNMMSSEISRRLLLSRVGISCGGILLGVRGVSGHTATDKGVEKIIDEFYAAYEKVDISRMLSVLSDDCFFEDPTFHLSANGKLEIKKMFEQVAPNMSNVSISVENRIVCTDWVVTQQRLSGVITRNTNGVPKSRQFSVRGATIFQVIRGKITRWIDYYDFATFSKQTA
jgi:steroid delta-isomerase-like uncharacterized protein